MSRKLLIVATFALSTALIPLIANAADDKKESSEMTKDVWLSEMNSVLPDVVCNGFLEDDTLKKRFDEVKITRDKCKQLIPDIGTKCKEQIYAKIPVMIDEKSASTWGQALGECIGKHFAEQYLIQ